MSYSRPNGQYFPKFQNNNGTQPRNHKKGTRNGDSIYCDFHHCYAPLAEAVSMKSGRPYYYCSLEGHDPAFKYFLAFTGSAEPPLSNVPPTGSFSFPNQREVLALKERANPSSPAQTNHATKDDISQLEARMIERLEDLKKQFNSLFEKEKEEMQ